MDTKPLRLIPCSVPTGGYHFREPDGTILRGADVDEVSRQIVRHRKERGLPIGNPEEEIHAQACARNPADCSGASSLQTAFSPPSIVARVQEWAAALQPQLVSNSIAQKRAENGCIGCPNNAAYGCCGDRQIGGAVAHKLSTLRAGRDVARYGTELFACSLFGIDTRTAVWMSGNSLASLRKSFNDGSKPPPRCWIPAAMSETTEPL